MNTTNKVSQTHLSSPLLSGLVYALSMMVIGTLLTSLVLLLSSTQESSLTSLTAIVHSVSLFIGAWVSGKRAGSRGWYHGGLLAIFYCVLLLVVGFLAYNVQLNFHSLRLFALLLSAGALGGILGVNTRK
ncbi:TIGR04086 family membrane protein [Paenibacillus eucommiae]|uniref:Membrane protein (TIGR04086 family) n=1 Tax=Paenibacillus eucommiae TaxID=1355755 RepID=A0ABS4JDH5_9BACL|nr:TIGR04086 family membrane protein [Paenibacillus eucommiae]MBP1996764.1 putative membrane protein (TIGR04086 family) [Paenibacillus eucommiae]